MAYSSHEDKQKSMKKRRLLASVAAMVLLLTAHPMSLAAQDVAGETVYKLFLWMKDGSRMAYPLDEDPQVSMDGESLTLQTTKTTLELNARDVMKFTLEDADDFTPTSMETVAKEKSELHFRQGDATITGMKLGGPVQVFDLSGHLLQTLNADGEGFAEVPTGSLPIGIFIIKTESITYKIEKK